MSFNSVKDVRKELQWEIDRIYAMRTDRGIHSISQLHKQQPFAVIDKQATQEVLTMLDKIELMLHHLKAFLGEFEEVEERKKAEFGKELFGGLR